MTIIVKQQTGSEPMTAAQKAQLKKDVQEMVANIRKDVQKTVRDAKAAQLDAQAQASTAGKLAADAEQGSPTLPGVPSPPPAPDLPPGLTEAAANWTPERVGHQVSNVMSIGGVILFALLVGIPLARAFARWIDRRGASSPQVPREVSTRLEAIEQAVESIAVEVERISEGQRFTTRLLSERTHEPVPDFAQGQRAREMVPVAAAASTSPIG